MAIGGKSLGIVSGLAVGLTSGVILAALNPIVPQTGEPADSQPIAEVTVTPAPEEKSDPALPKLSMVDTASEAGPEAGNDTPQQTPVVEAFPEAVSAVEPEVTEPVAEAPDAEEPEVQEPGVEPTQTAQLDALDPIEEPTPQVAMVLPENSDPADIEPAPTQPLAARNDTQPNVSTAPAEAVKLAEPTLDTASPEVDATEIAKPEPVDVSAVDAARPSQEPSDLVVSQFEI